MLKIQYKNFNKDYFNTNMKCFLLCNEHNVWINLMIFSDIHTYIYIYIYIYIYTYMNRYMIICNKCNKCDQFHLCYAKNNNELKNTITSTRFYQD